MVYLLCFHKHFKHAKHYIGYCSDLDNGLEKRMLMHQKGTGARLMEVIANAGIGFQIARLWPHCDRNFERRLKNRKNSKHLCPICKAMKAQLLPFQSGAPIVLPPTISFTGENV